MIKWMMSVKKKRDLVLLSLLSFYYLNLLLITYFNDGSLSSVIAEGYPVIGTFFFISLEGRYYYATLLKSYICMLYVLVILNLMDAILFRDLSSQYSTNFYFLGAKNQIGIALSLGFCFIFLYGTFYKSLKNDILKWIYCILILLTAILTKSGTAILTIALLIFASFIKIDKFLKPFRLIVAYLSFLLGVIYFKIQDYLKVILVDFLHKDITFTGRTIIWDAALSSIKDKLFLGHGMHENGNYFKAPSYDGFSFFSAHNTILQALYQGGILQLLLFFIIFLICCYSNQKSKGFKYLFLAIIAIFITWFAEAVDFYSMFLVLIFAYYLDNLGDEKGEL